jgi:hypothetical protein
LSGGSQRTDPHPKTVQAVAAHIYNDGRIELEFRE